MGIKVLSLFGGVEAGRLALDRAGIKVDAYYSSEIEKHAIAITSYNYTDVVHLGDATKWESWDIPWNEIDLLIGGFPCFVAGTKIITDKGYKNIEDVSIGDKVLTHTGKYQKVTNTNQRLNSILEVKAQGCLVTETTEEHPYYVRTMSRKYSRINGVRFNERVFSDPKWVPAKDLNPKTDYVGVPIINIEENPRNLTEELCWFFGRYAADGYYQDAKRLNRENSFVYKITLCIGFSKEAEFEDHIKTLKYTKTKERTVIKYHFNSQSLLELLKELNLGRGAAHKRVPQEILNLPIGLAKCFLDGYMSGDGSFSKGKFRATSISKELCMGLNLLIAKVHNTTSGFIYTKRPKTCVIEGRVVNQQDTYSVDFYTESKKQTHAKVIDGIIWRPVTSVVSTHKINTVYNLEVEEDNSYTANNLIVHNCQTWSMAGNQKGIEDPRGMLLHTMVDILDKVRTSNPKVFYMFENVKMKGEFLKYVNDVIGHEPVLLNSAKLSAQNRNRYYWANFEISQPEDKGILLKDIVLTDAIPVTFTERRTEEAKQIRREHRAKTGEDFSPRRGKELVARTDDKANCITANLSTKEHLVVTANAVEYLKGTEPVLPVALSNIYGGFGEDTARVHTGKSPTIRTAAGGGHIPSFVKEDLIHSGKALAYLDREVKGGRTHWDFKQHSDIRDEKSVTIVANIFKGVPFNVFKDWDCIRKFHPIETERLQTFPDNFTQYGNYDGVVKEVSATARYRAIGNSWTVDVIAHIFSHIKDKLK